MVGDNGDEPRFPVTIADERIGVNGAVAAALTRWVGSMPALYMVLVIFSGWMGLTTWWPPLHRLDPFPFPFLMFLNNVAQLVLCLVILVGQRVLGRAADHRAVQTYNNAEAIFELVADLQAHLNRHDEALSRGVSLLESRPHPWIERHRVQSPPQARDEAVGRNDRIAAWLTGRLSSVWAFYLAVASQVVWIVLAQTRVQRFDRYPFPFMCFLSTLAQLLFMIIIMVGQDVLGRAGDRRSEQTFLDAEAILYECRRMKARLVAQDRIIDSLTGYTSTRVAEQLAQAIHADSALARYEAHTRVAATGRAAAATAAPVGWHELAPDLQQSYRARAQHIAEHLAALGCLMVPASDPADGVALTDAEVSALARLEYERWISEQAIRQIEDAPGGSDGASLAPAPWDRLPEQARAISVAAARRIPAVLARAGFQVLRDVEAAHRGPTEADFSPEEWNTLQRAVMASGVLVALAEGVVDAEEMFALIKKLREVSISHPRRFIRELAAASTFETGLRPGTTYAEYEGPALQVIRAAVEIVERTAPDEAADFRELLGEIAETVADANLEGGFFGLGSRRRYGNEAVALDAVNRAAGRRAGQ
jgi:uncharacterized membrane protein